MTEQNIFFIIAGVVGVALGVLGFFLFDLKRKWKRMFGSAGSADERLAKLLIENEKLHAVVKQHAARIAVLEVIGNRSIQKIGFLRFNPFSETGGDNSFALTLLDRSNNGVIISSLYTREGVRVYAKSIEAGTPMYSLSKEEEASLEQALKG